MVPAPACWQVDPTYQFPVHLIYGTDSLHRYWGREIEAARYSDDTPVVAVAQVAVPEGVRGSALVHALTQTHYMPDSPENRASILKQVLPEGQSIYAAYIEVRMAVVRGDGVGGVHFVLRDGTPIEPAVLHTGFDAPPEGTWIFVGTHENDPERRLVDPYPERTASLGIEEPSPMYDRDDVFFVIPVWSVAHGKWRFLLQPPRGLVPVQLPGSPGPLVLNRQWAEDIGTGVLSDYHYHWLLAELGRRLDDAPDVSDTEGVRDWRLRSFGVSSDVTDLLKLNPML